MIFSSTLLVFFCLWDSGFSQLECGPTGSCSAVGHFVNRSLTFSPTTGKFSGTVTSNSCPRLGPDTVAQGTTSCLTQTFPSPTLAGQTPPIRLPSGGIAAMTVDGVSIFNPFEAGFGLTASGINPCSGSVKGVCQAGQDIAQCLINLTIYCGANAPTGSVNALGDSCKGHANPYHYHGDMPCLYNASNAHSGLIGYSFDGYGIYGRWESAGQTPPLDLDACGGHVGPIPANASMGIASSVSVYHYHVGGGAPASNADGYMPFNLGCYGPSPNYASCIAAYSTSNRQSGCGDTLIYVPYANGTLHLYDAYCPCGSYNTIAAFGIAPTATNNDSGSSSSTNTAAIIGGCVGGGVAVVLVVVLVLLFKNKANRVKLAPTGTGAQKVTAETNLGY